MYYIIFGLFYLFSLLPFWILYRFSDAVFLLLYYVIGYRKELVRTNLRNSFPEKSEQEINTIARGFYRNFTDNWIETIKLISISKKSLNKRMSGDFNVLHDLYARKKSVQLHLGHFFNWEVMMLYTGISQPFPYLTVYTRLTSKTMDRLMEYIRGRWGNPLIASSDMKEKMQYWKDKQYLLVLGADQSPLQSENADWLYFLHQPTGFVKGPEKNARNKNIPVVVMTTTRPKRGHYHFHYKLLCESPKDIPEGELVRLYVKHLESNIEQEPSLYLWSHRRWKRPWNSSYLHLWIDERPAPAD